VSAAASERRTRGTGSLAIRRDAAGREWWQARVHVGDGRYRKRTLGPRRAPGGTRGLTRGQAEAALRRFLDDAHDDRAPVSRRVAVREAGDALAEALRAKGRKRSTIEAVEGHVRVHLAPWFAGRSLDAWDDGDVERFVAAKMQAGLSPKTVRNVLATLHSIFELGRKRRWCRDNPVALADKPDAPRSDEIRFLDDAELEALLRAVPDDTLGPTERAVYMAAAMTGARQGELLALRWRDVDWPARRVRVRRAYVRGEYGAPKSRRSSRSVPLADRLAGELERHHRRSAWRGDDDIVFPHPATGGPLDRSKLLKRFKNALSAAGVREVRFHDLRHTFGTRMAAAGVPLRTVQEWMGHRDLQTTQVYADYAPSEREAEWVERAFAPAAPASDGDWVVAPAA
jgi:integrase